MVKVTFSDVHGQSRTVEGATGQSLMEIAIANDIAGITAECRGSCACATCQVYVHESWLEATGDVGEDEHMMLEFTNSYRSNSRLSCQIVLSEDLDGLRVEVPEAQT